MRGIVWLALIITSWTVVWLCYQLVKTAFLMRVFVS